MNLKNSTVMVTGAYGFIGSHLVKHLQKLGVAKIFAVDSMAVGRPENLAPTDGLVRLDHDLGSDPIKNLAAAIQECDVLFHLAAQKDRPDQIDRDHMYRTNLLGTTELFELAAKNQVRILYTSSLKAYGQMSLPAMQETQLPTPREFYGVTKLYGEHLLYSLAYEHDFSFQIVRLFFVYGPNQFTGSGYPSVIVRHLDRLKKKESPIVFGDGKQALDYIYVDDVIDAFVKAVEAPKQNQIYNIGSGQLYSILDLTQKILQISNSSIDYRFGPEDKTAGSKRLSDISKAKAELDWQPQVDIDTGLSNTYQWMQTQNEL